MDSVYTSQDSNLNAWSPDDWKASKINEIQGTALGSTIGNYLRRQGITNDLNKVNAQFGIGQPNNNNNTSPATIAQPSISDVTDATNKALASTQRTSQDTDETYQQKLQQAIAFALQNKADPNSFAPMSQMDAISAGINKSLPSNNIPDATLNTPLTPNSGDFTGGTSQDNNIQSQKQPMVPTSLGVSSGGNINPELMNASSVNSVGDRFRYIPVDIENAIKKALKGKGELTDLQKTRLAGYGTEGGMTSNIATQNPSQTITGNAIGANGEQDPEVADASAQALDAQGQGVVNGHSQALAPQGLPAEVTKPDNRKVGDYMIAYGNVMMKYDPDKAQALIGEGFKQRVIDKAMESAKDGSPVDKLNAMASAIAPFDQASAANITKSAAELSQTYMNAVNEQMPRIGSQVLDMQPPAYPKDINDVNAPDTKAWNDFQSTWSDRRNSIIDSMPAGLKPQLEAQLPQTMDANGYRSLLLRSGTLNVLKGQADSANQNLIYARMADQNYVPGSDPNTKSPRDQAINAAYKQYTDINNKYLGASGASATPATTPTSAPVTAPSATQSAYSLDKHGNIVDDKGQPATDINKNPIPSNIGKQQSYTEHSGFVYDTNGNVLKYGNKPLTIDDPVSLGTALGNLIRNPNSATDSNNSGAIRSLLEDPNLATVKAKAEAVAANNDNIYKQGIVGQGNINELAAKANSAIDQEDKLFSPKRNALTQANRDAANLYSTNANTRGRARNAFHNAITSIGAASEGSAGERNAADAQSKFEELLNKGLAEITNNPISDQQIKADIDMYNSYRNNLGNQLQGYKATKEASKTNYTVPSAIKGSNLTNTSSDIKTDATGKIYTVVNGQRVYQ